MFNGYGSILPINYNIQFKLFLGQSGFGALVVTVPHAAIPYQHADGTIWMQSASRNATWPFESVMKNLPDIPYEGRAYV